MQFYSGYSIWGGWAGIGIATAPYRRYRPHVDLVRFAVVANIAEV